jgi:hypothetical protein
MDEGWTRWILDTWGFPYTVLHNEDVRNGGLKMKFDVITLTSIPFRRIMEGHKEGTVPPAFAGGIGDQGLAALLEFVKDGGTLIALNASTELAVSQFKLPLRNVAGDFSPMEFYCPSTLLNVEVDNTHPIAYGMETTAAVMFFDSPLFTLDSEKERPAAQGLPSVNLKVVARYPDRNPFMSGFLNGEQFFHRKPALIDVGFGKGKIIIFGFRPQNRGQTEGTFKLFFNALHYGPAATSAKEISTISPASLGLWGSGTSERNF